MIFIFLKNISDVNSVEKYITCQMIFIQYVIILSFNSAKTITRKEQMTSIICAYINE